MKRSLRSMVVLAAAVVGVVLGLPGAAQAATSTVGYDVSYPQCGTALPSAPAFGVVGVNGGTATKANACLSTQLRWAAASSGAVAAQPKVQLYVNTANPGQVISQVSTWPVAGQNRYGTCDGSNSLACSYQYGVERATNTVRAIFGPAARTAGVTDSASGYLWWLDVETGNTWQTGSSAAQARNRATLEGMTEYLTSAGARVGLYSTSSQWSQVAGSVPTTSTLAPLPSWLAGATSLTGATTNCTKPPLTRGRVVLTQYVSGGVDRDRSCA